MSEEDKKHEPTDKRLKDAKQKGQVSITKDIPHLLETLVVFEVIYFLEGYWRNSFSAIISSCFAYITSDSSFKMAFSSLLWEVLIFFSISSLITCGIAMLCNLMGTWLQIGIIFTPEVLKPNFSKFNPVNNLKQLFSFRSVFNLLTNLLKALAVLYVIYLTIHGVINIIILLPTSTVEGIYNSGLEIFKSIERRTIILFIPLAVFDFAIQRHFYKKQLRMSDKELQDEFKEMEGDPHIKGERKQFAHDIVFGDNSKNPTKKADAVVVNPTHYAVALSYKPDQYPIPLVLARGVDEEAQELIKFAHDNEIPVIRYIWLARTLYADGSVNRGIPRTTLKAAAFVYRLIKELKNANVNFKTTQEVADEYTHSDGSEIMKKLMQK